MVEREELEPQSRLGNSISYGCLGSSGPLESCSSVVAWNVVLMLVLPDMKVRNLPLQIPASAGITERLNYRNDRDDRA